MSYPASRYAGKAGEASATFRAAKHEPEVIYPNGAARAHYLATGKLTRGLFGLYRFDMGPQPGGPGPHFHRTFAESFYVLSGSLRLYGGSDWRDAGAGDFLYVPEGGVHGFRNESGAPASLLILFAPGAPREAYFEGLVELRQRGASDEEMAEFYLLHDNVWLDES